MKNNSDKYIIEVENLYTELHSQNKSTYAMNDCSIKIKAGTNIGIVGESGSGKTQLFKAITGTQEMIPGIVNGNIYLNYKNKMLSLYEKDSRDNYSLNKEHSDIKKNIIGFIPQDPKSFLNPYWTLKQIFNITYKLSQRSESLDSFIEYYLELVDIKGSEYSNKYPDQLSGGQAQRVMIALVLSKEPDLIIADELTTGLDVSRQKKIIETFKKIKLEKPHITTIYISHDFGFLTHVVDEYYVLYGGFIVEHIKGNNRLLNQIDLHPYTLDLIKSLKPTAENILEDELSISSMIHSPLNSCPYINKCSIKNDIKNNKKCENEIPPFSSSKSKRPNLEDEWKRCWSDHE